MITEEESPSFLYQAKYFIPNRIETAVKKFREDSEEEEDALTKPNQTKMH